MCRIIFCVEIEFTEEIGRRIDIRINVHLGLGIHHRPKDEEKAK
jgi:hypothetical protein